MAGGIDMDVVLIVEDDPLVRSLLGAMLRDGKTVVEVSRGADALAAAGEHRPALILLDLGLPDMSGIEVLRILKSEPDLAGIPVIVVTGHDDPALVAVALNAGAVDYVRKPFGHEELVARVHVALRTKAEHDALRAHAGLDALTRLPNRRLLDEALVREHARAARSLRPLSVLLLDVDRFKAVNDHHGHAVGDAVLRELADRLSARCRASDVLGRWGGEEFMLIAPDTDATGARALAEDLRAVVAAEPCGGLPLTISIGAAAWAREGVHALVRRADVALYAAKEAGRDTVHVAGPRLRDAA